MTEKDVPRRFQQLYRRAMTGRSQSAAIRSFCLECMAYVVDEVRDCTSPGCPLFAYRLTGRKVPKTIEATHSIPRTRIRGRETAVESTIYPERDSQQA